MKNVKSLKLNKLSEQELSSKELNCLNGGRGYCCICGCSKDSTLEQGNKNYATNSSDNGGYGSGRFA